MKEFDFDELDKAVTSLMGSVPKTDTPEPSSVDDTTTLTIDTTVPKDDTPSFAALSQATNQVVAEQKEAAPSVPKESSVVTEQPATPAPVVAKRSGRFMDVVHPSSDMKSSEMTPSRPSRQGVTIAPVAEAVTKPDTSTSFVEDEAEPEVSNNSAVVDEQPSTQWPDPIESMDFEMTGVDGKDEAPAVNQFSEPQPLVSPFLPDTKVEKRPLGSDTLTSMDISSADTDAQTSDEEAVPAVDTQLEADPTTASTPLPAELQSDLVAIESDTTQAEPDTSRFREPKKTDTSTDIENSQRDVAVASRPAPTIVAPMAIEKQYREEPSTGDQNNGAIYDTDNYHQPLSHPAKKKSGWMWIVWIILILLVGAGGGALLYLSGIV